MNIFSNILLQVILISYPFIFYVFYNSFNIKNSSVIKEPLIDISLVLSIYLLTVYSTILGNGYYILINIPIVLSYVLNKEKEGILLSIIAVIFYLDITNINIIYILIEYIIYYLIYLMYKKYKFNGYIYLLTSLSIKVIATLILVPNLIVNEIYIFILECIVFYVITLFCYMLIQIGDKLIKYSESIKEIEKEKQIRETIFKVTHEIKNPIAVCKGYLDMINLDNKKKAATYIKNIKGEIEKTLILLQDFLSLRKIQINKDIIDITLLLDDNLELIKNYVKTKNVSLNYDFNEDEIYVYGDYNRLGQVITNIVKNSIEAVEDKKGEVSITLKIDDDNVYIIFKDNGVGMSEETLLKIKSKSYSTKSNGNGIGVILSNEIIEAHNGELLYDSKIGEGTKTTIRLPLYKEFDS